MISSQQAASPDVLPATPVANLQALTQREAAIKLRMGDIAVQIRQLEEQKNVMGPREGLKLNPQLAALQHQYTVAQLEYDAVHAQVRSLTAPEHAVTSGTSERAADPVITPGMVQDVVSGLFLLMLPLVIAMARRVWIRTNAERRSPVDSDNPRFQRLEEAVESIAIEIERVGEAQRFATKLLVERMPEAPVARAAPVPAAAARRGPGSITPH